MTPQASQQIKTIEQWGGEIKKYLHQDLTDKIIGACFDIYNKLGYGYPEKVYQKALENELKKRKLSFKRELYGKILYDGDIVGKYYLDFLVEDKIAVEFKVRREIYESDWIQLLNYLKSENLNVGLLIVFSKYELKIKRVINNAD